MKRIPLEFVKAALRDGTAPPSFVSNFLERKYTENATERRELIVLNIAYTVYSAAIETTISATTTFFYVMATHPEAQRKAQERSMALYREVLRYQPPAPIGVAHALSEDDTYNGYFIPKGATMLGNIWAMMRDEKKYPDPEDFKPERFFDANGELNGDDKVLAYGFGRRIWVGKHIANATLWITFASIITCFDIRKAKDEHGNEVNGEYEDEGLIIHKKPFKCSISPRSDQARRLVEDAVTLWMQSATCVRESGCRDYDFTID
ncbi:unnamed protein product [Cyclocybe aegerita]|uniref:Cytochrome P450 n=1 Tax=Cyclocybe aegerita TaxID=1973307 RepID=A0A8S0WAG4_CYCAE|nr:unnamed protein product [Cyclocybe aegerita]